MNSSMIVAEPLLSSLRYYLLAAGNKSIASGEQRAQLHVAVAALDAQRTRRPQST